MSVNTPIRWCAPLASIIALGVATTPALASGSVSQVQKKVAEMVAKADTVAPTGTGCAVQSSSQAFLPWGDPAFYTPAPQGDLESSTGWSLSSGAAVVADNSPFGVGSHALSLGSSGSAVTPVFCVDVTQPTVRFFVKNAGDPRSQLNVEVQFTDPQGHPQKLAIASLTAGAAWAPSDVVALYVNSLAAVSPTGTTAVSLHFTVSGGKGAWAIDDLQIDPFKPR